LEPAHYFSRRICPPLKGREGGGGLSGLFAVCLVHGVIDAAAVLIPSDCWGAHPSYTSLFLPATLILLITSSTLQCTLHIHPSSFQLHSSYSLPLAPYSASFIYIPLPSSYTHPTHYLYHPTVHRARSKRTFRKKSDKGKGERDKSQRLQAATYITVCCLSSSLILHDVLIILIKLL